MTRRYSFCRATFHKDVVIDIVGFRRLGHNETDEPMFTQPMMYQVVKKHPQLLPKYSKQLQEEGVVTQEEVDDVIQRYEKICEDAFKKAQEEKQVYHKHWLDSPWSGFFEGKDPLKCDPTGVKEETLVHIGKRFGAGPPNAEDFKIHRGLQRVLAARYKTLS